MNNVDISIQLVRQLQQKLYDGDSSPNSLFKETQKIIEQMNKASVEINQNYADISAKLTAQLNTGKPQ